MENYSLFQQIATMRQSFFDEEILDELFSKLESLASEAKPNFVEDALHLYFQDANKCLATIEEQLGKNPVDFSSMERTLYRLKGRSVSVGANKVNNEVSAAIACCENGDVDGVRAGFEKVKMEQGSLKAKLDSYFELVKQVKIAE